MARKNDRGFKIGDLVVVRELIESERYIFRPHYFPYGKPGLVIDVEIAFSEYFEKHLGDATLRDYPFYGDEYYWFHQELLVVLVEGQKWWLFAEELELYIKDE